MVVKEDKQRLHKLLSEAIPLLCRNGLALNSAFCVQAMIGVTVAEPDGDAGDDIVLVCFKQTISDEGAATLQSYGDLDASDTALPSASTSKSRRDASQREVSNARESTSAAGQSVSLELFDPGLKQVKTELNDGETAEMVYEIEDDDEDYGESGEHYNEEEGQQYEQDGDYDAGEQEYDDGSGYCDQNYADVETLLKFEPPDNDDGQYVKSEVTDSSANYDDMKQFASYGASPVAGSSKQSFHQQVRHRPMKPMKSARFPQGYSTPSHTPLAVGRPRKSRGGMVSAVRGTGIRSNIPHTSAESSFTSQGNLRGYNQTVKDLFASLVQQSSTTGGENYVCHICNAKLSNAVTLRNHIRGTHLALKTERCNMCGETFKWAMQRARHMKRVHGGVDGVGFQLPTIYP